jgi:NarL family two-component system sensor histidine kinase YdfH
MTPPKVKTRNYYPDYRVPPPGCIVRMDEGIPVRSDTVLTNTGEHSLDGYNKYKPGWQRWHMAKLFNRSKEDFRKEWTELKQVLPFFYILTTAMVFLYGQTLYFQPPVRSFPNILIFTLLMLGHLLLHWGLLFIPQTNNRYILAYLVIQTILVTIIVQITRSESLVFGLFMPLISELFGFGFKRLVIVGSAFSLVVIAIANRATVYGWDQTVIFLAGFFLCSIFVVIYVLMFKQQLELRQRAQALLTELETANKQLAEAATRIEDLTLVNERQRMARELHDTLAQGLAGVILQLEAADSHLSSSNAGKAQSILQQAMERARHTLSDSRRVIDDLRSGINSSVGLEEAIRREVQRFSDASGISCQVDLSLTEPVSEVESETIQRMVTEGLTNTARYAHASHAWVKLLKRDDHIELEVGDDGAGFDPEKTVGRSGHYGLLGMTERARLAGGILEIISTTGKGSLLKLTIPV